MIKNELCIYYCDRDSKSMYRRIRSRWMLQICEPHGFVKRIAMIRRTMLQALVEFESAEIAKKAKHAMNGADIYSGCCTLKVEFAKVIYEFLKIEVFSGM